jgi:hypothetical protein
MLVPSIVLLNSEASRSKRGHDFQITLRLCSYQQLHTGHRLIAGTTHIGYQSKTPFAHFITDGSTCHISEDSKISWGERGRGFSLENEYYVYVLSKAKA